MRRLYLYCLLAIVLAAFSACSDDDTPGGRKPNADGFFYLDATSLKDWDYGLSNGQCCLVFKADSAGGILACAIDKDSGKEFDFFVELNADGNLTGIGTPDEYYAAAESDDDYTLFKWNDSGGLEGTTVSKTLANQKTASRAKDGGNSWISLNKVAGVIQTIYKLIVNTLILDQDIQESRLVDFLKDLDKMVTGGVGTEWADAKDVFPDVITVERVTRFKEVRLANNLKEIFGDAEIIITDISKQPDGTYSVAAEVTGVRSIKRGEITVTTEDSYVQGENHVYAGVVCRQDYPAFINYYDYISEEAEITRFEGDVVYLSFTLPALGNGTYHVKPYMRSSINFKLAGEGVQYVKYGNDEEINDIGGRITDFTQADAKYDAGNDCVNFVAYVSAEIDSNDDLEEWGVYYMIDPKYGEYQRFPADMPTAKVKDDIRVEFTVNRGEFDYMDYQNFTAPKNIKFGVYKKFKNPTGHFDYLTYYYGDMSEFTVVYDKEPEIELYDARIIGQQEYFSDAYDRMCYFSFKAKVDGCFFLHCLEVDYGSGWNSEWKIPKEDLLYPKDVGQMSDGEEYTFESYYIYSSSGTEPYDIYISLFRGGNEVLPTIPAYVITCDNGSISQPKAF